MPLPFHAAIGTVKQTLLIFFAAIVTCLLQSVQSNGIETRIIVDIDQSQIHQ
jgi:hypothetical protein